MSWLSSLFQGPKQVQTDPLGGQRGESANILQGILSGTKAPQIPTWMQGPASTMGPLTNMINESLTTGMPTNVSAINEASRNEAMRSLHQDIFPQILEQFGKGGGRFGTGAMGQESRTAGDILTKLATGEAERGYQSQEAATNRRLMAAQLAKLPIEIQKYLMNIPELMQFILAAPPMATQPGGAGLGGITGPIKDFFGSGTSSAAGGMSSSMSSLFPASVA